MEAGEKWKKDQTLKFNRKAIKLHPQCYKHFNEISIIEPFEAFLLIGFY